MSRGLHLFDTTAALMVPGLMQHPFPPSTKLLCGHLVRELILRILDEWENNMSLFYSESIQGIVQEGCWKKLQLKVAHVPAIHWILQVNESFP